MFLCVDHPFQNHLKREKKLFPLPPGNSPDSDPHEDFCLDPDPQKNADPKPWFGF